MKKEEKKMCADGFDYRTAAGLHRDRLAEAESIRRVRNAKRTKKLNNAFVLVLRRKIGKQLITLGERIAAA
jgi:hypothetical protein